jgi:hypothetical protein
LDARRYAGRLSKSKCPNLDDDDDDDAAAADDDDDECSNTEMNGVNTN